MDLVFLLMMTSQYTLIYKAIYKKVYYLLFREPRCLAKRELELAQSSTDDERHDDSTETELSDGISTQPP